DADAVVGAFAELEFEAEDEVGILFFCVQVAAVVDRAVDRAVLHAVSFARLVFALAAVLILALAVHPAGQIVPVEYPGKTLLRFLLRLVSQRKPQAERKDT